MSGFRFLVQQVLSSRCVNHNSIFSHSRVKSVYFKNCNLKQLHTSSLRLGYEASGKTTGFIVNKNMSEACCIGTITSDGFELANGDTLVGPIVVFPHLVFSWHINDIQDVNEESMAIFKVTEPRIDLLILGYGNRQDYTPDVHRNFARLCKDLGIRFEALPTEQACGVYNFLAVEHRYLAAALIPPKEVDVLKLDKKKRFSIEDEDEEDDEVQLLTDGRDKKLLK